MSAVLNSARLRIPCLVGGDPASTPPTNALTRRKPAIYSTADLRVEVGLLSTDGESVIGDISVIESLTVRVKTSETSSDALLNRAVAAADLVQNLEQADWDAATDQHAVVEFSGDETNLIDSGDSATDFWLHLFYTTTDARQVTIYSGPIKVYPPRIPLDVGPISGATIVPEGAVYDGSGEYELTVIDGRRYSYTQGANDDTLVNGAETLSADNNFTAQAATVTLTGTPSALVTANVKAISTLTPEELDARYSRDLTLHRSSVAASEVSDTTETTVATVAVPVLGEQDEIQFGAVFTRPASQTENTLLKVYHGGVLIAVHTLDASPFTVIPLQHLFSNRSATNAQLGGCDAAGTLLAGTVDTTAPSTLLFKLKNQDAGDAATLQALTVKRIRG